MVTETAEVCGVEEPQFAPIERVYLPFAGDGERADMILGMVVYLMPDRA